MVTRKNLLSLIIEEKCAFEELLVEYEDFIINSYDLITIISEIAEIRSRKAMAYLFLHRQVQNELYLSLISILRRHETQSQLLLRHSIETACLTAYSLYETDINKFILNEKFGARPVKNIINKAYKWMEENYPEESNRFKFIKDRINEFYAHGNMFTALKTFDIKKVEKEIGFLDKKDLLIEKADIWVIGHIASIIFIVIYEVSKNSKIVETREDTFQCFIPLLKRNQAYREELVKEERFAKWAKTI